jgi:hypothetical protein
MSVLLQALLACHGPFRKNAADLHQVRVQVTMSGEPDVDLGKFDQQNPGPVSRTPQAGNMTDAQAMDAEQTANEIDLERALSHRVAPHPLTENMTQGLLDTMKSGPPFELTTDPQVKHTLQIDVTSYGLHVPYIGAPGEFVFDVRARLVRGDTGKVVYSTSLRCDTEAGDPAASAVAIEAVDHMREIERMSDAELQGAFNDMAYYCGTYFAKRMQKHAGG